MRKLLPYFLVIAACALVGCGESSSEEQAAETLQPVLKVSVAADGKITLNGKVITLEKLREEFTTAVSTKPVVWFYRPDPAGDPPEESRLVFQAIIENLLPISFSSEPDFSTVLEHDGTIRPRE